MSNMRRFILIWNDLNQTWSVVVSLKRIYSAGGIFMFFKLLHYNYKIANLVVQMGNSELQSQHNTAKSVLISHPIFEQAKIVKNTQGKEAVQIGISMKSEKDFLVW